MNSRMIGLTGIALLLGGCSQSKPPATAPGASTAPAASSSTKDGSAKTDGAPPAGGQAQSKPGDEAKPPTGSPAKAGPSIQQKIAMVQQTVSAPAAKPDYAWAIGLLDEVLAEEPNNPHALLLMMASAQLHGFVVATGDDPKPGYVLFMKSADAYRKVKHIGIPLTPQLRQMVPTILYNEACSYALAGEPDKAIASLGEALDAGFRDKANFDKDTDLDSLRDRDDFKKLAERFARKQPENQQDSPKSELK